MHFLTDLPSEVNLSLQEESISVFIFDHAGGQFFRIPTNNMNDKKQDVQVLYHTLCHKISQILHRSYFEQLCGYKGVLFFPSERSTYATNIYNKSADLFQDNLSIDSGTNIRISQALFNEKYLRYQDFMNLFVHHSQAEEHQHTFQFRFISFRESLEQNNYSVNSDDIKVWTQITI